MRLGLALFLALWGFSEPPLAQDIQSYDRWTLEVRENQTEAYTRNDSNMTFGIYCANNQCVFYVHATTPCLPNQSYPALVSTALLSRAITMQCSLVGNKLFLIANPFNTIFQATQIGDQINFAFPIQGGEFLTTRFSLQGARQAITETLQLSSKKITPKPAPSVPPTPPPLVPKITPTPKPSPKDSVT